tara:strand:+ start:228 stop:443 length:216 start_codon:yes stop_codon:yes gene_type:complete
MLQINPKKFKSIKNKTIPSPLRPRFRNKDQANIYFLSKRKYNSEKKDHLRQKLRMIAIICALLAGGYILSS